MSPDRYPLLEPGSRAELRAWLAANHATSPGVNLAIGKKGTTVTELRYDDAVEEGLAFGWIDSTARRLDEHRFTVLFTPRKRGSVWARTNKERVARLSAAGSMAAAGSAAVEAAKADGSWDLLNEVDSGTVPDDLRAALEATPGAAEGFAALPAGARRIGLYWIASAKRPDTRARRITATVTAAVEGRPPVS
jgi:uncharacterized protein YdeI (YjbR/CyaY-like superfamily)